MTASDDAVDATVLPFPHRNRALAAEIQMLNAAHAALNDLSLPRAERIATAEELLDRAARLREKGL